MVRIEYAESFAAVSHLLAKRDGLLISNIMKQNLDILKEYTLSSKFVVTKKLHTELINYALSLQDEEKSSVLMVIGGHIVNIMLSKNGKNIACGYYDSYEGQLYKQYVTESDLQYALGNDKFAHPFSILNGDNVLLGRVLIRDDTQINTSIDFVILTYVTDKKNMGEINTNITLDKNIKPAFIVKFLAKNPAVIKEMARTVEYNAFSSFLTPYNKELLTNLNIAEDCMIKIKSCSNTYLYSIIYIFDGIYNKSYDVIKNSYNHSRTSTPLSLPKTKGKLCIKEVSTCYKMLQSDNEYAKLNKKKILLKSIVTAEKEFFKIIYIDKVKMQDYWGKCVSEDHEATQGQIADSICKKFINDNNETFGKAVYHFYDCMDLRKGGVFKEQCMDQDGFFSDNNYVAKHVPGDL